MKYEHSKAAAAIRKELKAAFKGTKFRVTSESYAGGNSVHISWEDGPKVREVEQITGKYQYGKFDGMTDYYDYTNVREDIPQVKYILTSRSPSKQREEEIKKDLENYYEITDDSSSMEKFGIWFQQLIWRVFTGTLVIHRKV
jgi:hypothetical protein